MTGLRLAVFLLAATQDVSARAVPAGVSVQVGKHRVGDAFHYTVEVANISAGDITEVVIGAKRELAAGYLDSQPFEVQEPEGWHHKLIPQQLPKKRGQPHTPRWQLWFTSDMNFFLPPDEREEDCASCPGHRDDHLNTYSIHAGETRVFRLGVMKACPALESAPIVLLFSGATILYEAR